MSVDTTTLILGTKSKDGLEYRVKCVQAVENIIEFHDVYCIKSYFSKCPVFTNKNDAWEEAHKEEKEHFDLMGFYSEYGVMEYDFPDQTFSELIEREKE